MKQLIRSALEGAQQRKETVEPNESNIIIADEAPVQQESVVEKAVQKQAAQRKPIVSKSIGTMTDE
ncbi:MAG: hypothetical protein V1911_03505, partial [Candidatus Micrarchaeota archaeon]